MTKTSETAYDAVAARLTDPTEPLHAPASVLTGEEAANYGKDFLLREYGSQEAIEQAMRRGRPAVGTVKRGPSPVVRGVIPAEELVALNALVVRTGKAQSELVRQAVHDLLVAEKLVG